MVSGIIAWVVIIAAVFLYVTRRVDDINLPFVNDPAVIGTWRSVDFVDEPEDFKPDKRAGKVWLYLESLEFKEDGKMEGSWWRWTKDFVIHKNDHTAARYTIKEINGRKFMFFEWKSGDYVYFKMKPKYYVLEKVENTSSELVKK